MKKDTKSTQGRSVTCNDLHQDLAIKACWWAAIVTLPVDFLLLTVRREIPSSAALTIVTSFFIAAFVRSDEKLLGRTLSKLFILQRKVWSSRYIYILAAILALAGIAKLLILPPETRLALLPIALVAGIILYKTYQAVLERQKEILKIFEDERMQNDRGEKILLISYVLAVVLARGLVAIGAVLSSTAEYPLFSYLSFLACSAFLLARLRPRKNLFRAACPRCHHNLLLPFSDRNYCPLCKRGSLEFKKSLRIKS